MEVPQSQSDPECEGAVGPEAEPQYLDSRADDGFLEHVRHHRWYALWVLVASTGVRRSELCGVEIAAFDLLKKVVRMAAAARVIAGGKAVKGSGKSQKSRRLLELDSFTTGVLTVHFQQVEKEKEDWGDAYQDHGLAFC